MANGENQQEFLARVFEQFSKMMRDAGPYLSASYVMVGAVVGMMLVGYFVDRWLGTEPWILVAGTLIGVAVGLYEMARIVLKK